ncbi:MAG: response regulator [Alphaproteobacteria bacterium]
MRVLVVDRDPIVQQIVGAKLENMGHQVFEEAAKNTAVERLANEEFDVIMLDPSPLTSPRPIVLNIRRNVRNYPYIFMLSDTISAEEALKSGVNDLIAKPVNSEDLSKKMACAEYFSKLVARIGDDSEDFPSAGGVIAKSAFNQLFLSAIDRADRYGEQTYVLFISVNNYQEIKDLDGNYAAEYASAKLSQYLVRLRRQSDIIGQTEKHEFTLLLQRPLYETEPVEAANRFAEALGKYEGFSEDQTAKAKIKVTLLSVPTGRVIVEHIV